MSLRSTDTELTGIKGILDKLDRFICILGIVGSIAIMGLYLKSPTVHLLTLGGALFLASLAYLILSRSKGTENTEVLVYYRKSVRSILEATFIVFFAMSLLIFHSSETRTAFYFLLVSLCTGIIALLCMGVTKKMDVIVQIVNIILLSLDIKLTKFYFYGGSGVDYWGHLKMNEVLSQIGTIGVLLEKEQFFPIMHINVAITQIIPDLPIKDASMFSISLPLIFSSICVYLIARELFDERIGLLGMLIVNVSDFHNWWGFAPQTTTYGAIIFFFSIFVLYKFIKFKNKSKWLLIVFIMLFTMIITHAVSSFILFITLIGLIIGSFLYGVLFSERQKSFFPILLVIYAIGLIQNWFIVEYRTGGSSFFDRIVSTLDIYVTGYAGFLNRPEAIAEYAVHLPPLSIRLVNNSGLAILIFLAVIGSLYWLSPDFRSRETFSILICTVLLLGFTFVFPLFGIRNIIPHRWFVFEYLFLGILAAFAIVQIAQHMSKKQGICIIFVLFTCLSFFMLTGTSNNLANHDSPLWLKESTISTTYTVQEIKGAETISCYSDGVFSDSRYGSSILGVCCGIQTDPFYSTDLSDRTGRVFIWRNYMEDRPIRMFKNLDGYYKPVVDNMILGHEYLAYIEKMQKIYVNDDVRGYYII